MRKNLLTSMQLHLIAVNVVVRPPRISLLLMLLTLLQEYLRVAIQEYFRKSLKEANLDSPLLDYLCCF